MTSLDVLRDLQNRVSSLERQLGDQVGADNLTPNVLTFDPTTNRTGAAFTGDVTARSLIDAATGGKVFNLTPSGTLSLQGAITSTGLIIPAAATTAFQPVNQIEWERQSDGSVVASIGAGINNTTETDLISSAQVPGYGTGNQTSARNRMQVIDLLGAVLGYLEVQGAEVSGQGEGAAITAAVPGSARTLLTTNGASDFAQINTTAKVRFSIQTIMLNIGGGAGSGSVPHGLGVTPDGAVCCPIPGGSLNQYFAAQCGGWDATNASIYAQGWGPGTSIGGTCNVGVLFWKVG